MPLTEPINVGTMTLPNRLIMPAMRMDLANPDGTITPALVDWYQQLSATTNMAMCIVAHTYVLPEGKVAPHQSGLFAPYQVPGHSEITRTLHDNDTLAVLQLGHGGGNFIPYEIQREFDQYVDWKRRLDTVNHILTPYMNAIGEAFVQAAILANEAGYDGVEIHAAHHFLLATLYSPLTNQRRDYHGGNLKGRTHLLRTIVSEIRKALGIDFLILVRLPVRDLEPYGATPEDAIATVLSLEMQGLDAVDLTTGIHMRRAPVPAAFFHEESARVRAAVNVPVIYSGGITTRSEADHILGEGIGDIVGVGRGMQAFTW